MVEVVEVRICTEHAMVLFGIPRAREFKEKLHDDFLKIIVCKLIENLKKEKVEKLCHAATI